MTISKRALCGSVIAACALLTGCGAKKTVQTQWVPDRSTVTVDSEGKITETLIDTFDQSWYNSGEFAEAVAESINDFDSQHGSNAVSQVSFEETEGQIRLVLNYAADDDYAAYNNVSFFSGSMLGAEMEGFKFDTTFTKVKDGAAEGEVDRAEVLSHKEYEVLITDMSHAVQVPGDIVYITGGAQLLDSRAAAPSADIKSVETPFYIIYEY